MKSYFRPEIDALAGYTPGEQPKMPGLVKLNTNENPYPPSPRVAAAIREFAAELLRLYPDPTADALRDAIAERHGCRRENVICGNGSDDLLTMVFRAFTDPVRPMAMPDPSYSLYPVLAAMQGAESKLIPLTENFELPEDFLDRAKGANLLAFPRPNAPTGASFGRGAMEAICRGFDGIVLIDEAYADFADDCCLDFATRFDNVIVMRTFSKSYSLAGLRLGYAVASFAIIDGLMKLKDSYNVDRLSQTAAFAAFEDREYLAECVAKVKATRARLAGALRELGFRVVDSQANFVFASPPGGDGGKYFEYLRRNAVIVRYFAAPRTRDFVRISIGTDPEIDRLLELTRNFVK